MKVEMRSPENNILAYMWFDISTSLGNPSTGEFRDTVGKRLMPEQLAEAKKRSQGWLEKFDKKKYEQPKWILPQ
jgi:hypothetical protein